jgi:hypothetical protein
MPNQYYSPNAKLTGGCLFASFNSKDGAVYLKLLKQVANNPDKKGNFDGKNPLNIKLSQDEAADMIRAVRTNGEAKFYHKFDQTVTSGGFKYWVVKSTEQGKPDRQGFGLSVKRGETEIKVSFTLGSAERFSLFLQNALTHFFDAEYSQDLKDYKESQAKKAANPKQEKIEPESSEDDAPPANDDF